MKKMRHTKYNKICTLIAVSKTEACDFDYEVTNRIFDSRCFQVYNFYKQDKLLLPIEKEICFGRILKV